MRLLQFPGSVIKHQLISSLTLGMALRLVLDSLRKPADSKVCIVLWFNSVFRLSNVKDLSSCFFPD